MSALPVLPLWVTKYEGNTAHLTLEEDGAYTRLLRLCWRTPGCSVPADAAWVARHMRVDADTFARAVKPILDEFFTVENGRWQNVRLLAEYQSATEKTERRKAAGQKGGKAKALKSADKQSSNAKILPDDSSGKPEPKPQGDSNESLPDPKGSGPSAADVIFQAGKSLLAKQGVDAKAAGTLLGKLRKVRGAAEAERIITALMASPPLNAEEYLWGIVNGKAPVATPRPTVALCRVGEFRWCHDWTTGENFTTDADGKHPLGRDLDMIERAEVTRAIDAAQTMRRAA